MSALRTPASKLDALAAMGRAAATPRAGQLQVLAAFAAPRSEAARASLFAVLAACAPSASLRTRAAQAQLLIAKATVEANVASRVSQDMMLIAYGTGIPITKVANSWTFVLDGHTFWVVSLGPEGDWAYDTVTKQWCQLISQGFDGLNFTQGVMWGLRIMGGDVLYPFLYELDPTQPDDEGWRPVKHIVTGGVQTRSQNMVGVANFSVTASVGNLSDATTDVNLTFSDDNGHTWVGPFTITLAQGATDVPLLWSALGSFNAPGRVFQIADSGGMLSIYGADAALDDYDEDNAGGGPNAQG